MPAPIPAPMRQRIIELASQGTPLTVIAASYQLSYHTVRHLWRQFRHLGPEGLTLRTSRCGRQPLDRLEPVLKHACLLKGDHPTWGAGYIRIRLKEHFSKDAIPSIRSLQLAFVRARVNRPRRLRRSRRIMLAAQFPHDVWQVDAVEKKRLADGRLVSWLDVTDEASGAILEASLSPPGAMARSRST